MNERCTVCAHLEGPDDEHRGRFRTELRAALADRGGLGPHGKVIGVGQRPDGQGTLWLNRLDAEAHIGAPGTRWRTFTRRAATRTST